jgi:hypothetical protein
VRTRASCSRARSRQTATDKMRTSDGVADMGGKRTADQSPRRRTGQCRCCFRFGEVSNQALP